MTPHSDQTLQETRAKLKAAYPGGSGHGWHHPPPCAAKGLLAACSSKQGITTDAREVTV